MMYDFKNVLCVVNGKTVVGFYEGDCVVCERNEDRRAPHVDYQSGETVYATNKNKSGKITILLQHISASNRDFQALLNSGAVFSISVRDTNPHEFISGGNKAIILREPQYLRGPEIKGQAWEFYVSDYYVKK